MGKKRRQQEQYMYTSKKQALKEYQHSKPKTINIIPRSRRQEAYLAALTDESKLIVLASGPAGTGKTMLGLLAGIKAYKSGLCDKIVLTRPAVGVDDEKHGFLPGDLNAKMEPWTRPLYDIFHKNYTVNRVKRMVNDEQIEIAPLAFMRGRTFENCYIIADEMQNTTVNQFKMLLTRIGEGSKLVITGDLGQTDRGKENGMKDFLTKLKAVESKYIFDVQLHGEDIQRHHAVTEALSIYGD